MSFNVQATSCSPCCTVATLVIRLLKSLMNCPQIPLLSSFSKEETNQKVSLPLPAGRTIGTITVNADADSAPFLNADLTARKGLLELLLDKTKSFLSLERVSPLFWTV